MTISTTSRKGGPYVGNGATTSFAFAFKTFASTDLQVILTDSTGAEAPLTKDVHYTVALNADQNASPGGSITYPISGSALTSSQKLTILSTASETQSTDLVAGGGWSPETIEDRLDYITALIQQHAEKIARSILAAPSDATALSTLPSAANRAGKFLAFDALGSPTVSAGSGGGDTSLRTDLANATSGADGSRLVGFRRTDASSVPRSAYSALAALAVTPEDFGAVGDGATNDKAAVQAAIDSGKSVYFPNVYFCGSYSTAATEVPVLTITGKSNTKYFGPGGIKVTSSSTCVPRIFDVDNSSKIEIDLYVTDSGFDRSITYRGAIAVNCVCAVGRVYDLKVKLRGSGLVCGFNTGNQSATTPTYTADKIHLELDLENFYYGAQFRNCGDNVTGYVKGRTGGRYYFVYGAHGHRLKVSVDDHQATFPQTVLIKCYDGRDTYDIDVDYSCTSFVASTAPVYIGNETTTGKVTRDITIRGGDVDSTNTNPWSVFIESTTAGVRDATTTKVVTGIKVVGHWRFVPYVSTSFQNTDYKSQLVIELEGDVARKVTSVRPMAYGWTGTPMPAIGVARYLPRWKIGDKVHSIYVGAINSAEIHLPIAPNENLMAPVEMFIDDAVFASTGYQHRQVTYFAQGASSVGGAPSVFGNAVDFNSTNGALGSITQGTQVGDNDKVAGIKFTFAGWTAATSGYIRFVHPDLSRDETAN